MVLAAAVLLLVTYAAYTALAIWNYADIDETQFADVALVLGASAWDDEPSPVFLERINHGIWLYKNAYVDTLIFTGGVGDGDAYSESSVARNFAIEQGVLEQDIFIEELSSITEENIYHAVVIMRDNDWESALIVSDPLHMKRAMLMAEDAGITAHSSPTPTSSYQSLRTQLPFLAREVFFYIGYLIFR